MGQRPFKLPPCELLEAKLHKSIRIAREQIAVRKIADKDRKK